MGLPTGRVCVCVTAQCLVHTACGLSMLSDNCIGACVGVGGCGPGLFPLVINLPVMHTHSGIWDRLQALPPPPLRQPGWNPSTGASSGQSTMLPEMDGPWLSLENDPLDEP